MQEFIFNILITFFYKKNIHVDFQRQKIYKIHHSILFNSKKRSEGGVINLVQIKWYV